MKFEISSIEDHLPEQDPLKTQRAEVQSELEDLRTRIDQLDQQAVEEFNDHLEAVLVILDYTNLGRIWIVRAQEQVCGNWQNVSTSVVTLYIVCRSESGTTTKIRLTISMRANAK